MLEGTTFGRTMELLEKSLSVSTLRHQVIGNNIANADVPNFKRSSVNFESFLSRALEQEKMEPLMELAATEEGHMPGFTPADWHAVQPRRVLDYVTTAKNNGNNVDPEQEFMDALENQLRYTIMTQAAAFEFNQVNLVLK